MENQSEPISAGALEGNQDHHKPRARTERLQTRTKGKAKDLFPDTNSASSILLNADDMTIMSEEDGYEDFNLNAEHLCNFYGEDRGDKQTEHQGTQTSSEGTPEEAPLVEEVMMGDEEDGKESHGIRQEERKTNIDDMEEEEAAERNSGGAQPAYKERDLRGTTLDAAVVNGGQPVPPSSSGKSGESTKRLKDAGTARRLDRFVD